MNIYAAELIRNLTELPEVNESRKIISDLQYYQDQQYFNQELDTDETQSLSLDTNYTMQTRKRTNIMEEIRMSIGMAIMIIVAIILYIICFNIRANIKIKKYQEDISLIQGCINSISFTEKSMKALILMILQDLNMKVESLSDDKLIDKIKHMSHPIFKNLQLYMQKNNINSSNIDKIIIKQDQIKKILNITLKNQPYITITQIMIVLIIFGLCISLIYQSAQIFANTD